MLSPDSTVDCTFLRYESGFQWTGQPFAQFINLFGFYWTMNFVTAFGQMTVAGAFVEWYLAVNKEDDISTFPLIASFARCFYHLGTLACGAAIID